MSKANWHLWYCPENNKLLLVSVNGDFFIIPRKNNHDLIYYYIGEL